MDVDACDVYDCGSLFVALLAYPDHALKDQELLAGKHSALCALAIRKMRASADPAQRVQWIKARPAYWLTDKEVKKSLGDLDRRLDDRMIAAKLAGPDFSRAITGMEPRLPANMKRASLNRIVEFAAQDLARRGRSKDKDMQDTENVETRQIRFSRPVIHLARAFTVVDQLEERRSLPPVQVDDLLFDRDILKLVISLAEFFEACLPRLRLPPASDQIIRVRLKG